MVLSIVFVSYRCSRKTAEGKEQAFDPRACLILGLVWCGCSDLALPDIAHGEPFPLSTLKSTSYVSRASLAPQRLNLYMNPHQIKALEVAFDLEPRRYGTTLWNNPTHPSGFVLGMDG